MMERQLLKHALPRNPPVMLQDRYGLEKGAALASQIRDGGPARAGMTYFEARVFFQKLFAPLHGHSDAESRKLCKKMKVDLSAEDKKAELFHYQDGAFHTEYNRAVTFKSIVAFLKDPKGPPLWEEDPGAKDVVHIDNEKDFRRLLKKEEKPILMMFYAPWCSVCKRIMPHFQKAATQLRGQFVLAGMNVYPSEFESIKEEYSVRGYPTICYFEKGRFLFQYDSYGSTAEDIVEWLKNPQPPQPQVPETPWADEGGSVYHLSDEDFDQFVKEHSSVLVMFHAPWCGHCKKMKPEFENAAEVLHGEGDSSGVLAAVDATVNKALAERFHISEFPTLKYFKNGEKHAVPALRTKKSFIEWMRNPESPPPPDPAWEEQQTSVLHLAGDNFRESLKRKKHALVMFYAPWCPHCKKAIPHFTAAADAFKDDRKIACAAIDCVKEKNKDLCQQEAVKAYPTFHYYHYGKFVEKYDTNPTIADILSCKLIISFISSMGVSYMMLCTENYPNVLAFSFLDELQKEFITTYNMMKTNTAVRPYCFIEFDNFIQRTKQRYNNPRSLSTKINLSDMQMEIKLRPPYQISMGELGSANGVTSAFSVDYKGAGKISSAHQRLEPATLSGIVAFILSLLCAALNLIRGFHAIESLLQSDGEDFNYIVAFFLGTAACLYQ
ncbi:hypothetical protein JEQ12_001426, partial [Ovis aries]